MSSGICQLQGWLHWPELNFVFFEHGDTVCGSPMDDDVTVVEDRISQGLSRY